MLNLLRNLFGKKRSESEFRSTAFFSGKDLATMLGQQALNEKSACRKCGTTFSFEDGVGCARKSGITDNVVMCPKCCSIYQVGFAPGFVLRDDVSQRYIRNE